MRIYNKKNVSAKNTVQQLLLPFLFCLGLQTLGQSDSVTHTAPDSNVIFKEYQDLLGLSEKFTQKRKFEEALKLLDKAIILDSGYTQGNFLKAVILSRVNRDQEAKALYNKIILHSDQADYMVYYNRAISFYKLEDMDSSCLDYEYVKQLAIEGQCDDEEIITNVVKNLMDHCDSSKVGYFYQRGIASYNLGQLEKSIDIYRYAISKFGDDGLVYSFAGNSAYDLKKYELAYSFYGKVLQHKTSFIVGFTSATNFQDSPPEQMQQMVQAGLGTIKFSRILCQFNLGDFNQVSEEIKALKSEARGDKTSAETFLLLEAAVSFRRNRNAQTLQKLNQIIEMNPFNALAHSYKALVKLNSLPGIKFSKFYPGGNLEQCGYSFESGKVKINRHQLLGALFEVEKAIDLDPLVGFHYFVRGTIMSYMENGNTCADKAQAKKLSFKYCDLLKCTKSK